MVRKRAVVNEKKLIQCCQVGKSEEALSWRVTPLSLVSPILSFYHKAANLMRRLWHVAHFKSAICICMPSHHLILGYSQSLFNFQEHRAYYPLSFYINQRCMAILHIRDL